MLFRSQLRSKIDFTGAQARANTETNATPIYITSANSPSGYSFIASEGGTLDVTTLGGLAPFPVEGAIPVSLRWFEIRANNVNPKPAARQIGSITVGSDGVIQFHAGADAVDPGPLIAPKITSLSRSENTVRVSFTSVTGANYRLRASNAVGSSLPTSAALGTPVAGTGSTITLEDTSSEPQRFYLVEVSR